MAAPDIMTPLHGTPARSDGAATDRAATDRAAADHAATGAAAAGAAGTRSASYEVPIDAAPDVVWQALTDPQELERWFPLTARVTPGPGGSFSLRWRDRHSGDDWRVLTWESGRHLSLGMPKPAGAPAPDHIVNDFVLASQGEGTILRVVASGFDPEAEWDAFFNGVRRGWRFELGSLKHYLEHHRGRSRAVAWAHAPIRGSYADGWRVIFGRRGWVPTRPPDHLHAGDRYALTAPDGTSVSGTVSIADWPTDFSGTIDELNNGILRVQIEASQSQATATVWAAAYGIDLQQMIELEQRWQPALETALRAG
jgi:uncharacterized protein YndB with AHSA1/START domain